MLKIDFNLQRNGAKQRLGSLSPVETVTATWITRPAVPERARFLPADNASRTETYMCVCVKRRWGEGRGRREQLGGSSTSAGRKWMCHMVRQWVKELLSQVGWWLGVGWGGVGGRCMGAGCPSVLQHGLVALEHTLRHLGSSALQGDLRRRWEVRGRRSHRSQKHFSHAPC